MLQGKRTRRIIAATLLIIMATNILAPTVTYALTSGPTAPEATSFEPIDTTDMVNLQTGNFTYNLPLLEVPGPEGGYPLSLSYHAGIQLNEDASWVGLGWTLNPGAISRSVNGYPDDWQGTNSTSREYWAGGNITTYSPGISIGLANTPLSVNAGLSFSNDTYQGFGMSMDVGIGISASLGASPLIGNMNLGISSNGQGSVGGGVSAAYLSESGLSGSMSAYTNTNFESLQAGFTGGMGIGGASLLQASMSTNGSKPSLSAGGYTSSVSSSSAARVQTKSSGWHIEIPTPVPGLNASFGYNKTRYWTDENTNVTTKGSIYNTYTNQDNVAYDNYSLLVEPAEASYIANPDPTIQQGGAYPAFDNYDVNAQGLSGSMRPYQFQGAMFGQNMTHDGQTCNGVNCDGYNLHYFGTGSTNQTPRFRFVNDFSNRYQQESPLYDDAALSNNYLYSLPIPFGTHVTGDGTNNDGFLNNQLAGSKHIDIGVKVKPSQLLGYNTSRLGAGMIEGFSITNSSGVMYTFGLPAYSYNEESYQEKKNQPADKPSFTRQTKQAPYAYTWYLTSITGPDFVDRNGNNQADEGDWGYWVNFEYGKWSDNYAWRTPSENYNVDEDNEWQNCSMGYKEIYYLNAVRTRTHVALFEKDNRPDAKGSSPTIFDKNGGKTYSNPGSFDAQSVSSLRLSHIYLLNAADKNIVSPSSSTLNGNVLDVTDVEAITRSALEAKALRIIDFNHDNTLCNNTPNSFYTPGQLMGKLTLKSIATRGRSGQLFPPMKFEYDSKSDALVQADVQYTGSFGLGGRFTTSNGNFKEGDMIMSPALNTYFGTIISKTGAGPYTYTLTNGFISFGNMTVTVRTTKNPTYKNYAYDSWGMYKSDFPILFSDINQAHAVSDRSAQSLDAWSLRSITTELGNKIKINYEPDSYLLPETDYNRQSLMIEKMEVNKSAGTIVLTINNGGDNTIKLSDSYQANDNLNAVLLMDYYTPEDKDGNTAGGLVVDTRTSSLEFDDQRDNIYDHGPRLGVYPKFLYTGTLKVAAIDNATNKLTVQCTEQFLLGNQKKEIKIHQGSNNTEVSQFVVPKNYYGGNLFINAKNGLQGGGIRIRSLAVEEPFTGVVNTTVYDYNDSQGKTSGVTTYSPGLPQPYFNFPATQTWSFEGWQGSNTSDGALMENYIKFFKKTFLANNGIVFTLARDMPPPGVMYGNVTVSSYIKNPAESDTRKVEGGKTEYQFEVFKDKMVARIETGHRQQGRKVGDFTYDQYARYYTMYKFVSCLGNTKKVIHYDESGRKLSETINHYLHDGLLESSTSAAGFLSDYKQLLADKFNSQGYINERYGEVKSVGYQEDAGNNGIKATITQKEELPCIATGQTVINYVNGTRTNTDNVAYDFYSGDLTKSVETDTYGNQFMTETVPAYRKYPNTELGLKINGGSNLNMLTQTAAKYLYKVEKNIISGDYDNKGYVSASATTWGNGGRVTDADGNSYTQNNPSNGNVWRIQSTYDWLPNGKTADGLTATNAFTDLNWSNPGASAPSWKKTSEISLYDVYSHSEEGRDMNGNYSAMRMDYGNKKVIMSGTMANYSEIAFSGAEDASVDQSNTVFVKKADGIVSTAAAHTGSKSLKVGVSGQKGFVYNVPTNNLTAGRSYLANVWVKPVSGSTADVKLYYAINGVEIATSKPVTNITNVNNGWTLLNIVIQGTDIMPGATLTVGGRNESGAVEAYLDDFRFRPLNGTSTAYVYDAFTGELTHVLDNSNVYTRYEYDAAGKLVRVYKEKLGLREFKTNEYQYNWGHSVFVNDPISRLVPKNNCGSNEIPSSVQVNMAGGLYTSFVSPGDANAQAMAKAQDQANTGGTCNLIYARRVFQNTYSIGSSTYGDIAVYFYSDAACTQPYNVSNLVVNWTDWFACDDSACGEETTTQYSRLVSGTSAVLEFNLFLSGSGGCFCTLDNRLSSGHYNIVF